MKKTKKIKHSGKEVKWLIGNKISSRINVIKLSLTRTKLCEKTNTKIIETQNFVVLEPNI